MLRHDLFYIVLVRIGVPDLFGVDHGDGALAAAVHAAGLVHPHPAGTRQAQVLDPLLGVVAQRVGAMVLAAGGTVGALVTAEEDVVLVIGHDVYMRVPLPYSTLRAKGTFAPYH